METPLVSILIPCFNAERWIAGAIDSALAQTWPDCEVVVVENGSTDASSAIIERYAGRIRWESMENHGGNVARNRLLELARGEWLQYLDADDWLQPDKVANQMRFCQQTQDVDIVFGPVTMEYWSEAGSRRELLEIPEPHDPWVLLARWFLPQTGAPLWRKQAIVDVGGWKPDQPCCQEHELYGRLLRAGKVFRYFEANGAVYRQWSQDTVCNRDISEVHRRRLEIKAAAEEYLQGRNELTTARRQAINQGRFEIARIAWQYDQEFSQQIMATVARSNPAFEPSDRAAPSHYRWAYRWLGFRRAEQLATLTRRLRRAQTPDTLVGPVDGGQPE